MSLLDERPACACCSGAAYDACCGPLHRGTPAPTPEALMRSRYTAFARGDRVGLDHLFRTWHPRTRPPRLVEDGLDDRTWTGLVVRGSGTDGPDSGWVDFEARWTRDGRSGVLREHSRFARRAGRWVYVDGDLT